VGHHEHVAVRQAGWQGGGEKLAEVVAGADLGKPADRLDV
jgi:hypothetical protein